MFLLKLFLALGIIIAALVLVFRFQKRLKGESGGFGSSTGKTGKESEGTDLEEFIAAYRRDKAAGGTGQTAPAATATPTAAPVSASPVAAARPILPAGTKARSAFLAGPGKLAFLVLKAGLPDHHVFAHARLSDLIDDLTMPALANMRVDMVVCDKDLAIVAAVDLPNGAQVDTPIEREKEQRLSAAGIRYVRFGPGRFPRPAEVRGLIYPA